MFLFNFYKLTKNKIFEKISKKKYFFLITIVKLFSKKKTEINKINDFLFVHIPKNAGSSFKLENNINYGHIRISNFNIICNKDIKSFAVIREPIDRFCSAYYYLKEKINNGELLDDKLNFNKSILTNSKNINEFIQLLLGNKAYLNHIFLFDHFLPQYTWIMYEGKVSVDYLINFHEINNGIHELNKQLNKNFTLNNKINSSIRKNDMVSNHSRKFIESMYSIDIKIYNKISNFSFIKSKNLKFI